MEGACVAGGDEEDAGEGVVPAEGEKEGRGEVGGCEDKGTPGDVSEEPWLVVVWFW